MVQLAVCFLIIVLLGIEFCVYGVGFRKIFRVELQGYETAILGFFVYFGMFQIVALPLILLQRPFHELVVLWLVATGAMHVFVALKGRKELGSMTLGIFAGLWRMKGILLAAVILLVAFACWFQGTQQYIGWDTTYYIGTINTTVYTDTMYVYDGNSGVMAKTLELRYALSAFYMHSALLCKLASLSGILIQKYVIGTICILMHGLIVFAIGRRLFPDKEKKALFMTGLVFLMHLGFQTMYTASDFLLIRGYEAKGFCANVVIPAVFYAVVCLWQDKQRREYWVFLFMICFSSVPVSMSSILIVPAMVVVTVLAEWLLDRKWKILWQGFLCAVPNGIYLVAYFLYTQGVKIMIHK